MWNPSLYLKFGDERTQPCRDLIARVPFADPQTVLDLGCGPANSTAVARARWPQARITGVDSSVAMLAQARASDIGADWIEADVATWRPAEPADVIFTNAALQWVPDHAALLPDWFHRLRSPGVFAMQIPDHLESPAHCAIAELCGKNSWRKWFQLMPRPFEILRPDAYYRLLGPLARKIEIWQTIYWHVLERPAAIIEWLRASGLRLPGPSSGIGADGVSLRLPAQDRPGVSSSA